MKENIQNKKIIIESPKIYPLFFVLWERI